MANKQLETITFLTCLREMLSLSLDNMEGIDENEKKSLKDFLVNESTDYEIMHFVNKGYFPNKKYNNIEEQELMESIKDELTSEYFTLSESISEDVVDDLIESLVPLSEYGLSSSPRILEYLKDSGNLRLMLSEDWKEKISIAKKKIANVKNKAVGHSNADFGDDLSAKDKASVLAYRGKEGAKALVDKGKLTANELKKEVGKNYKKYVKPELKKAGEMAHNVSSNIKSGVKDFTNKVKNKAVGHSNANFGDDLSVKDKASVLAYRGKEGAKEIVGDVKNKINQIKQSASASEIANKIKSNAVPIGGAVLGAALLFGAYKTYKRFFSKAARACSGKSGPEREVCITNFKKNATKAQINDLKRSLAGCKSSKNPQRCQASIQAKIQKLQSTL